MFLLVFLKHNTLLYTNSVASREIRKTLEHVLKLLINSLRCGHVHIHTHTLSALLVAGLAQEMFETASSECLAKPYHPLPKAPLVALSRGQHEESLILVHW